jgi:hypothetical protein
MAKIPRSSDPDLFLAMIDTRVAALQHLRASYLAAKAAGAIGESSHVLPALTGPSLPTHETGVPAGARGDRPETISSEVERLLIETPKPMKVRDIAAALRRTRGGQATTKTPAKMSGTINSILHRLKHRGRAVRWPEGWLPRRTAPSPSIAPGEAADSLSSPGLSTPAPDTQASPVTTTTRSMRQRRSLPRRSPRRAPKTTEPTPDHQPGGLAWRIESLLKSHGQPVAARYVAEATGEPLNVVGLALGRMVRQQRVEKQADGHFTVVLRMGDDATNGAVERPQP